jgi:two-component system response regulator NreC
MTRILLADDHRVVLEGLRLLLASIEGLDVVGEAQDGKEAIAMVEDLQPDVLIMDLMMPNLGGLEATRQIEQRFPSVKIIILSMHDNDAYIMRAFDYGAEGYVLKDASSEELISSIQVVMHGERYLSPVFANRLNRVNYQNGSESDDLYQTLTPREREVFKLVAEGHSSTAIAELLSISSRTVETHRSNFMKKLGLKSQTDLVRVAIKQGVISLDN